MKLQLIKFLNEYFVFQPNKGEIATTRLQKKDKLKLNKEEIEKMIFDYSDKTGVKKKEWDVKLVTENNVPKITDGFLTVMLLE